MHVYKCVNIDDRSYVVTWRSRDSEDLLTEASILLCRVDALLGVQNLVHFGQNDLPQVE